MRVYIYIFFLFIYVYIYLFIFICAYIYIYIIHVCVCHTAEYQILICTWWILIVNFYCEDSLLNIASNNGILNGVYVTSVFIHIWRFPERGVPPNHPCSWDFPLETNHSGVPPLMEPFDFPRPTSSTPKAIWISGNWFMRKRSPQDPYVAIWSIQNRRRDASCFTPKWVWVTLATFCSHQDLAGRCW